MKKEVVIIGGGPAGLAAAIEAKSHGCEVLVIDENRKAGGQLFKQLHKFFGSKAHSAGVRGIDIGKQLLKDTEESGDPSGYQIFDSIRPGKQDRIFSHIARVYFLRKKCVEKCGNAPYPQKHIFLSDE